MFCEIFLAVPWIGLGCVIVVFPDHAHLFFVHMNSIGSGKSAHLRRLTCVFSVLENAIRTKHLMCCLKCFYSLYHLRLNIRSFSQSELPRPILCNSVESDLGCTSRNFFDNLPLTSQKPC